MLIKLFISCIAFFSIAFFITSFITAPAFALTDGSGSTSSSSTSSSSSTGGFTGRTGSKCPSFLGFTSWDCGVNITDQDSLKTGIWQIVANVATDITVAAAYLVIGYVIYGGYLYTFSGGDPGKVATGRKTLAQAFIGLAIVMFANIIMNFIRIALLNGDNALRDCVNNQCVDPGEMITSTIQWAIGVAGVVSAIFVVYGGISYTTSAGDPSKLQKAKQMITYALIGLAVVALAEIITAFVSGIIRDAKSTGFIKQTIISKEAHEVENHQTNLM